ncbi:enamine deaminase RidA (YjgF/YER057c/UK114 family) [Kribbella steppae]|uniref:Enamine deaminase RidA (YjgF/YER057c/UK114 family) n=1 Tax=Kribbella steppae TaxID=2512223 RepID=A0A4R2HP18_9ACTN|nr:RidA family protein [Kribbella steppae]TCO32892.1 enamine deaminase RidA (YjgF/YER057c/UK114 family) [Kribbella steppae]
MITPGPIVPDGGGYRHSYEIAAPARTVYVSGQIPVAPDGTLAQGFAEQCRQVWANVAAALAHHGMDLSDLVKVTTFLSDRAYRAQNSAIRREVLGDHAPALTVIITGIYDEAWLLEIEAIAAR